MNVCNINIIIMNNTYKSLFLLDPKITHLNHGSFGACPKPIFDSLINPHITEGIKEDLI